MKRKTAWDVWPLHPHPQEGLLAGKIEQSIQNMLRFDRPKVVPLSLRDCWARGEIPAREFPQFFRVVRFSSFVIKRATSVWASALLAGRSNCPVITLRHNTEMGTSVSICFLVRVADLKPFASNWTCLLSSLFPLIFPFSVEALCFLLLETYSVK